ncbi:MAG: serine/threonine-protein phosphatase, partial [Bacteroidia bacterium]|nr:serine/threonine-protein phosphatase [Bacteroidia bacterium]
RDNRFYLAICDCTGHGVPGAFMSLLNISFLNEAINEKNIVEPNRILNHVRDKLIHHISQDGAQDGMDAILLCIEDSQENNSIKITYAAANNSPLLIRDNKLSELPYDKMPVGKGEKMYPFSSQKLELKKGDSLYLYTDGYADQFGGEKGKKLMYKQLNEMLLANSEKTMEEQKNILDDSFEKWKGKLEQIDDVCIFGISIKN